MNKKLLLITAMAACVLSAAASWEGDGYYRVQNYKTARYSYLLDNTAKVDVGATYVDLSAIELWTELWRAQSDPSTVLYIRKVGDKYDIKAQGSSVHAMVGEYVSLRPVNGTDSYLAYGTYQGWTVYLGDNNSILTDERAYMSQNARGEYRQWYLQPISAQTDNFFGIQSTLTVGGKHYASLYCDFPFSFVPSGMEAAYVTEVDSKRGLAIYETIASGIVPASTPVFIKCVSDKAADNKVNVGASGATAPTGNLLKGQYFNNSRGGHINRLANDPKTMRFLGQCSDGSLGYVASTIDYVPRNSSYLVVGANAPAELKLVTRAEYDYILANEAHCESITLTPSSLTLTVGDSQTVTATVNPANAVDQNVTWTTSDAAIATVNAQGTVTAVADGSATITATCDGVSATCTVTVSKRQQTISWNQELNSVYAESEIALTASASSSLAVTYTITKGAELASVSGTTLRVNLPGEIEITASQSGNKTYTAAPTVTKTFTAQINPALVSIAVSQSTLDMLHGDAAQLTASITPAYAATLPVTWTSSNSAVATVDADGKVQAVGAGSATITAQCIDATASCQVTVSKHEQQITWTQDFSGLEIGHEAITMALEAAASSGLDVAYTLDNGAEIAQISGNVLTITGVGAIQITASQEGNDKYAAAQAVTKQFNVIAGICSIENASIKVNGSTVDNPEGKSIEIYSISGIKVYGGNDSRIVLPSNDLYIIRSGELIIKYRAK